EAGAGKDTITINGNGDSKITTGRGSATDSITGTGHNTIATGADVSDIKLAGLTVDGASLTTSQIVVIEDGNNIATATIKNGATFEAGHISLADEPSGVSYLDVSGIGTTVLATADESNVPELAIGVKGQATV